MHCQKFMLEFLWTTIR